MLFNHYFSLRIISFTLSIFMVLNLCANSQTINPSSGTFSLECTPNTATIFVDRIERGSSPLELQLLPGLHFMEIKAEGYQTELQSFQIAAGEMVSRSIMLEKECGIALICSEPSGADIKINGIAYGKTPCLVADLPFGTYQAELYLGGFRETMMQFVLKDRIPIKTMTKLVSNTATLNITSNVESTEIKVNGIIRGATPCQIDRVPAGEVVIEAFSPGYKPYTQLTKLGEAETLLVDIRLEVQPAVLRIVSIPDKARVYVNDSFTGETPLLLENVAPGDHRVRIEKKGFDPLARTLTLGRAEELIEEFRLKSNTAKLVISSEPEGVTVYLDNVKVGITPESDVKGVSSTLELEGLTEGNHTLRYSKPGYFDKTEECILKRGDISSLRVSLVRRFIPDYEVNTTAGTKRGMLVSISGGVIRLETKPGIFVTVPLEDVVSHGKIK